MRSRGRWRSSRRRRRDRAGHGGHHGREGGIVVGVDSDEARLEKAMVAIRDAGGRASPLRADALDATQVQAVVDSRPQRGRIDILVNAVGGSTIIASPGGDGGWSTLADWQRLLAFNLNGTFLFCHAVAPVMKRQRGGKIVNISSIAGRGLSPTAAAAPTPPPRAASSPSRASCPRAGAVRGQCERHRAEPHAEPADSTALGAALEWSAPRMARVPLGGSPCARTRPA